VRGIKYSGPEEWEDIEETGKKNSEEGFSKNSAIVGTLWKHSKPGVQRALGI
jgi:hypothetical protein